MRKEILALAVITLIAGAFIYQNQTSISSFEQWKIQYGVNWNSEEEFYRKSIFEKNVAEIKSHNTDTSQTYKMEINQFTALTKEEFVSTYLAKMIVPEGTVILEDSDKHPIVGDIDWTTVGRVSPVKNQGQCGSCWAFSATGAMESTALSSGYSLSFSEQQLVDCSGGYGNQGCNGGWPSQALRYIKDQGINLDSAYPYQAQTLACRASGGPYKIADIVQFSQCSGLMNGLSSRPLSITVDATNWGSYGSGVFGNCGGSINHAVLLVGIVGGNWKVKNSWGTGWGEGGFIRLAGTDNVCGICNYPGVAPS